MEKKPYIIVLHLLSSLKYKLNCSNDIVTNCLCQLGYESKRTFDLIHWKASFAYLCTVCSIPASIAGYQPYPFSGYIGNYIV